MVIGRNDEKLFQYPLTDRLGWNIISAIKDSREVIVSVSSNGSIGVEPNRSTAGGVTPICFSIL